MQHNRHDPSRHHLVSNEFLQRVSSPRAAIEQITVDGCGLHANLFIEFHALQNVPLDDRVGESAHPGLRTSRIRHTDAAGSG